MEKPPVEHLLAWWLSPYLLKNNRCPTACSDLLHRIVSGQILDAVCIAFVRTFLHGFIPAILSLAFSVFHFGILLHLDRLLPLSLRETVRCSTSAGARERVENNCVLCSCFRRNDTIECKRNQKRAAYGCAYIFGGREDALRLAGK